MKKFLSVIVIICILTGTLTTVNASVTSSASIGQIVCTDSEGNRIYDIDNGTDFNISFLAENTSDADIPINIFTAVYSRDGSLLQVDKTAETLPANTLDLEYIIPAKVPKCDFEAVKIMVWDEKLTPYAQRTLSRKYAVVNLDGYANGKFYVDPNNAEELLISTYNNEDNQSGLHDFSWHNAGVGNKVAATYPLADTKGKSLLSDDGMLHTKSGVVYKMPERREGVKNKEALSLSYHYCREHEIDITDAVYSKINFIVSSALETTKPGFFEVTVDYTDGSSEIISDISLYKYGKADESPESYIANLSKKAALNGTDLNNSIGSYVQLALHEYSFEISSHKLADKITFTALPYATEGYNGTSFMIPAMTLERTPIIEILAYTEEKISSSEHIAEESDAIRDLIAYLGNFGIEKDEVSGADTLPDLSNKRAVYVSTGGSDLTGNGSLSAPFASIEKACEFITANPEYIGGWEVVLREGRYNIENTVELNPETLSSYSSITFTSYPGENAVLTGSKKLDMSKAEPVAASMKTRLHPSAAESIVAVNLSNQGIGSIYHPSAAKFGAQRGNISRVMINGVPGTNARWPNEGYAIIDECINDGSDGNGLEFTVADTSGANIANWNTADSALLNGFFSDSDWKYDIIAFDNSKYTEKSAAIDLSKYANGKFWVDDSNPSEQEHSRYETGDFISDRSNPNQKVAAHWPLEFKGGRNVGSGDGLFPEQATTISNIGSDKAALTSHKTGITYVLPTKTDIESGSNEAIILNSSYATTDGSKTVDLNDKLDTLHFLVASATRNNPVITLKATVTYTDGTTAVLNSGNGVLIPGGTADQQSGADNFVAEISTLGYSAYAVENYNCTPYSIDVVNTDVNAYRMALYEYSIDLDPEKTAADVTFSVSRDTSTSYYPSIAVASVYAEASPAETQVVTVTSAPNPSATIGAMTHPRRFYIENLLEEIDLPGEWYIDKATNMLYLYPQDINNEVSISVLGANLLDISNISNITFENLVFDGGTGDAIKLDHVKNCSIKNCDIKNTSGTGVRINESKNTGIEQCDLTNIGANGVTLYGGSHLTSENTNMYVKDCIIEDFAQLWRNGSGSGIIANQVIGAEISHNRISRGPYIGIYMDDCVNCIIEYNDISNVQTEYADAGAIYSGSSFISQGNVLRYNYIHDIVPYSDNLNGYLVGIYMDDLNSGFTIHGNIIRRVPIGIMLGGGKNLTVSNNIIMDSSVTNANSTINADSRGLSWAAARASELSAEIKSHVKLYPKYLAKFSHTAGEHYTSDKYCGYPTDNTITNNFYYNHKGDSIYSEYKDSTYGNTYSGNYSYGTNWSDVLLGSPFMDETNQNLAIKPDSVITKRIPGFKEIPFADIGLINKR